MHPTLLDILAFARDLYAIPVAAILKNRDPCAALQTCEDFPAHRRLRAYIHLTQDSRHRILYCRCCRRDWFCGTPGRSPGGINMPIMIGGSDSFKFRKKQHGGHHNDKDDYDVTDQMAVPRPLIRLRLPCSTCETSLSSTVGEKATLVVPHYFAFGRAKHGLGREPPHDRPASPAKS